MDVWKEEYAASICLDEDRPKGKFHHVHPRAAARAHCNETFELDMDTLTSERPTDGSYCKRCYFFWATPR